MSLPTYIRRRRTPDPAQFLAKNLGPELLRELDAGLTAAAKAGKPDQFIKDWALQWSGAGRWNRVLQAYKHWEEKDFDGYYVNPPKRHVRPFWLLPKLYDEQAVTLGPAGTAAASSPMLAFEVDTSGHFEIAYTLFQATDPNFLVQIFDGGNVLKSLMNREVHARTIAGSARRPLIWPETYFVNAQEAARTIFVSLRNLSLSSNTVRWAFHGRRWYHKEADDETRRAIERKFGRMEKTYTYFLTLQPLPTASPEAANAPGVTLAAGQSLLENQAPSFKATDEADTEVHKVAVYATAGPGSFDFQIREKRNGRTLSNGFVTDISGWGDGEFPFVYPETFLIERNHEVSFEVRNLAGVENVIYPTLIGRRLQYA